MRFSNRINNIGLVAAACILLISCGSQSNSAPSPNIQTIQWQLDGSGFVQYSTNDAQNYNKGFFTTYNQTNQLPMTTVTVKVKKQSGSTGSGYGIVFCSQDSNNLYRLLIDTGGHYTVSAKVANVYNSPIIPWTASTHLNSGVGVENEISVTQQTLNHFTVYFNGNFETTFNDMSFSGGKAGFYVSISPTAESFPYTPVDVRFKMSSPMVYP